MRWSSRVVLGVFSAVTAISMLLVPAPASADTETVSQQIRITAIVLPAQYVVVNANGQVQQIISNSYDINVNATVYQDSVKPENIKPLTPEITLQIANLLKGVKIEPGIIYQRQTVLKVVQNKNVLPLLSVRSTTK